MGSREGLTQIQKGHVIFGWSIQRNAHTIFDHKLENVVNHRSWILHRSWIINRTVLSLIMKTTIVNFVMPITYFLTSIIKSSIIDRFCQFLTSIMDHVTRSKQISFHKRVACNTLFWQSFRQKVFDRHELSSENLWPTLFVSICRITEILIFAFKQCNTVCAICGFVEILRPTLTIDCSITLFFKCGQ